MMGHNAVEVVRRNHLEAALAKWNGAGFELDPTDSVPVPAI